MADRASRPDNGGFVSWGRYDAEHHALVQRVGDLEADARTLRGMERMGETLAARITVLEQDAHHDQAAERTRRDRLWVLALTLVSGVVFPILVTAMITYLHLKSYH